MEANICASQSDQHQEGQRHQSTSNIEESLDQTLKGTPKDEKNNQLKIASPKQNREKKSPNAKQINNSEESEFQKLKKNLKYAEFYDFEKLLGQGAFCSVYQALDKKTGETIAVKVIRKKTLNSNDVFLLRQEAEILKGLNHENIVQFKHMREVGSRIFLGMELLKGGQLTKLIKARKDGNQKFTDEEASKVMRCILKAVQYIHQLGIIHRDLKPDNILIDDINDLSTIKIADFGLSAKYEHSSFASVEDHCGTLIFMAPEVAFKKEYSKSVDIWSTGIIMYMLLSGGSHPLFQSLDDTDTYKEKLKRAHNLSFPSHFSMYTATEALQHPWITRINKSLIPLTLPDRMKHIELEFKLQKKISTLFFISVVKISNQHSQTQRVKQPSKEDLEISRYKRLLDKVSRKIDKWHEENKRKEIFAKDEEYIELDRSPTHFETSSDDEGKSDQGNFLEKKQTDSTKFSESNSNNNRKNPKTYNDFKLSLQETSMSKRAKQVPEPKEEQEDSSFFKFLVDNDALKGKGNGNFERKRSVKKSSNINSPIKRDSIKKVKAKSFSQVTESNVTTNQASTETGTKVLNPEKPVNSSFSTYISQYSPDLKQQKKQALALYSHVNYASSQISEDSPESLRTTFINSDRQNNPNQPYSNFQYQQMQNMPSNKKVHEVSMVYNLKTSENSPVKRNSNISQRQNTYEKNDINSQSPHRKLTSKIQSTTSGISSTNPCVSVVGNQNALVNQMNLQDIIKKNEGYDQKFLFKKNFIPKQKPVIMPNQHWQPGLQQYPNQSVVFQQNSLTSTINQVIGSDKEVKKPRKKSQQMMKVGNDGSILNYITLQSDNFDARMIKASELQQMAMKFWETQMQHPTSESQFQSQKHQRPKRSGDLPQIISKQQMIQMQKDKYEHPGVFSSMSKQYQQNLGNKLHGGSKKGMPFHIIRDAEIDIGGRPNSIGNSHNFTHKLESPYTQPTTQMNGLLNEIDLKGNHDEHEESEFKQIFSSQTFNKEARNSQK